MKNGRTHFSLMKLTALLLAAVLVPLALLSTFFSQYSLRAMMDANDQAINNTLSACSSQLQSQMIMTNYLLNSLFDSQGNFLKFVKGTGDWHQDLYRNQITNSMSEAMDQTDACDSFFLYVPERDELTFVNNFTLYRGDTLLQIDKEVLKELNKDTGFVNGRWHLYFYKDTPYLIHIIKGVGYQLGASINLTQIMSGLDESLSDYKTAVQISTSSGESHRGLRQYSAAISPSDAVLSCDISFIEVYKSSLIWIVLSFVLLLLALASFPFFYLLFRRHIGKPLLQIQSAFHELEQGHEDYRITAKAASLELEDTFVSFNKMAESTHALKQQSLKEMEEHHRITEENLNLQLDNLQLQIRPHFLQNNMNFLYTLIQNHQIENSKRLVLYLSDYFRYMFRYGHELELFDKELTMVKEYLEISQIHYANAFTVSYQLDPVLEFLRVPPLLLHNFVENIIKHSLISGQTVHIILYGEYDEEKKCAVIQISDDGRGMDPALAEMINTRQFDSFEPGQHVGIRNSINRLNHYYNAGADVHYDTYEDRGTTVTITIPCDLTIQ